jgi:outer membrane biosynthesis protein TonB
MEKPSISPGTFSTSLVSIRCMRNMLSRFLLVFALASTVLVAAQKKSVPSCCLSGAERVSPQQVKALLSKTEPIQAPCCGHKLHIDGIIVLEIAVDANGDVTCVTMLSGHPLIIGSVIDSVRRWKFRPYAVNGQKKSFCGKVTLSYVATDYEVNVAIQTP